MPSKLEIHCSCQFNLTPVDWVAKAAAGAKGNVFSPFFLRKREREREGERERREPRQATNGFRQKANRRIVHYTQERA